MLAFLFKEMLSRQTYLYHLGKDRGRGIVRFPRPLEAIKNSEGALE